MVEEISAIELNSAEVNKETPSTEDSDIMALDVIGTYPIVLGSWRQAQHPLA